MRRDISEKVLVSRVGGSRKKYNSPLEQTYVLVGDKKNVVCVVMGATESIMGGKRVG